MSNISLGIAFIAGILSFLSPCVLPLIPGYISFISGISFKELHGETKPQKSLRRAGFSSLFFVLGFSLIFIFMGASASLIGRVLSAHIKIFTKIAGILIIFLGLNLLGIFNIGWLNVKRNLNLNLNLNLNRFPTGYAGALLAGMAFAFGWTPCFGPILGGILTLAATQDTLSSGISLLVAYSFGIGIPFILTGFFIGMFTSFFRRYRKFIRAGEVFSGILLIIVGILVFSNNLISLLKFIPNFFYKFAK
jgi:cytochrome c-type biogenesis protein